MQVSFKKNISSEKGIFLTLEAVDQISNTLAGTKLRLMFFIVINHHAETKKKLNLQNNMKNSGLSVRINDTFEQASVGINLTMVLQMSTQTCKI